MSSASDATLHVDLLPDGGRHGVFAAACDCPREHVFQIAKAAVRQALGCFAGELPLWVLASSVRPRGDDGLQVLRSAVAAADNGRNLERYAFHLVTVTDGPMIGLQAVGIGSNIEKRTRASFVALAVAAVRSPLLAGDERVSKAASLQELLGQLRVSSLLPLQSSVTAITPYTAVGSSATPDVAAMSGDGRAQCTSANGHKISSKKRKRDTTQYRLFQAASDGCCHCVRHFVEEDEVDPLATSLSMGYNAWDFADYAVETGTPGAKAVREYLETEFPGIVAQAAKNRIGKVDVENIRREEGLSRPISDGPGYEMMLRMGWRVGQTLGPQPVEAPAAALGGSAVDVDMSPRRDESGPLLEPLRVVARRGRPGIGGVEIPPPTELGAAQIEPASSMEELATRLEYTWLQS